jgi:AcrR family transcriptional regulator
MVTDTSGERVEPELIRDRSLAAADELFYKHGITSVGIDAVRDRAGVGLKGIYREFGSKAGLVSAYLAHRDEQWMSWLEARVAEAGDGPRQRLLGLFDALDAWFASPGFAGCAFINAFGETAGTGPVAEQATQHKERLAALVENLVAQLDRPRAPQLREELMLLIEGAIVRASLGHRPEAARTARGVAALLIDDACAVS